MHRTILYTTVCTKKMQTPAPSPNSIPWWRTLAQNRASWTKQLGGLRDAMAGDQHCIYLSVIDEKQLASEIERVAALAADQAPLKGVPFVAKDNIDVQGLHTTAACPAFSFLPERSAAVIERLQAAGAICLAKTNLDQFATGLVGTRSPYGAPVSALAEDRISGGSSSGSAVAVARGHVPFSLGTDTAGSGRVPAMFNGLVGLKPTPGRVSTRGVVPACASLDCVSIFSTTLDDAQQVLALVEGSEPGDPFSRFSLGPPALPASPRVGVPSSLPESVAPWVREAFATQLHRLAQQGVTLVPFDMSPLEAVAALLYEGPWVAERWIVVQALLESNPEAIDPTVKAVIRKAESFSAADAFKAHYRLRSLSAQAEALWASCDVVLVPTAPDHPTPAEVAADPIGVNARLGAFTNFVNLLGWSALAAPCEGIAEQPPFGITLIGPANHDVALAELATRWSHSGLLPARLCGEGSFVPAKSTATLPIVVVGAHLSGLPLNGQLLERGARLARRTHTAPWYRLYALPDTVPPKPGMQRVLEGGVAIEVELWDMPLEHWGSFLRLIPAPLGLGTIELADGSCAHGFLCESHALVRARDISAFGGWRAFLSSSSPS